MTPPRKFDHEKIIKLISQDYAPEEISESVGCSVWTIQNVAERIGRHDYYLKCVRYYRHQFTNNHPLYYKWSGIKARIFNTRHVQYKNYGGRGIKIYEPWINDFPAFESWINENLGVPPDGASLDRINNNGNYEPGNLRWASSLVQIRNRSNTRTQLIFVVGKGNHNSLTLTAHFGSGTPEIADALWQEFADDIDFLLSKIDLRAHELRGDSNG